MTLSWGGLLLLIWGSLALGLSGWRTSRMTAVVWIAGTVVALALQIWSPTSHLPVSWNPGSWLAVVWFLGFGWSASLDGTAGNSPRPWGWLILTTAGLSLVAGATDGLTMCLALELTRVATAVLADDRDTVWERPLLLLWGVALALWLFATGGLDFTEWRVVLLENHTGGATRTLQGKPSLMLLAAVPLTIFAIVGPVCWSWRWDPAAGSFPRRSAALIARQMGALLALRQLFAVGLPGLTTPCITVLVVLAAVSGLIALRALTDPQRLDRALWGLWHVGWSAALLWLTGLLVGTTWSETPGDLWNNVAADYGFRGMLLHATLCAAAVTASLAGLLTPTPTGIYHEQLRGLGLAHPWRAGGLILPVLSAWGVLGLAGGWFKWTTWLVILGVHQAAPDAVVLPHYGLRVSLLLQLVVEATAAATIFRLMRRLLFDPTLGETVPAPSRWRDLVILLAAIGCLLGGLWPFGWE